MDTQTAKQFIIVADDSPLISRVLFNKLTAAGYEVQVAVNGDAVLEAVAARKPDLLLLDLIMPIKDGFATLQALRADPAFKDLKVVVTSDLQQAEDIQKVQQLGVLGVFDKANLQEIVKQVPQLLAGTNPKDQTTPQP